MRKRTPKITNKRNDWKKFEYVVAPTGDKNWFIEIENVSARSTDLLGIELKEDTTIKVAIEELLKENFDEKAIVTQVAPFSKAHICPSCNGLILSENRYEICDECKQHMDEYYDRVNMSDEEREQKLKEDYIDNALRKLQQSITSRPTTPNEKLN